MCRQIYNEQVTGFKAREWLGYVGGALVACGAMTLDELKALRARVYRQESELPLNLRSDSDNG
jgi:hypothetical protein